MSSATHTGLAIGRGEVANQTLPFSLSLSSVRVCTTLFLSNDNLTYDHFATWTRNIKTQRLFCHLDMAIIVASALLLGTGREVAADIEHRCPQHASNREEASASQDKTKKRKGTSSTTK